MIGGESIGAFQLIFQALFYATLLFAAWAAYLVFCLPKQDEIHAQNRRLLLAATVVVVFITALTAKLLLGGQA